MTDTRPILLRIASGLAALTLMVVVAGCSEPLPPSEVAGTFVLESVNGAAVPLQGIAAPVAGSITLATAGMAERKMSYDMDGQGAVREFVASGTYQLEGAALVLVLQEGTHRWSPRGRLVGTSLTLTYPNPADGPDIVELYRQR